MIYLDNSATTPIRPEVREYIYQLMGNQFGNPSSLYDLGIFSEKVMKESRKTIAQTLKVKDDEIYFTSCGSESNNLAIKGIAATYHKRGRHIITTAVEHPSVLRTVEYLGENGFEITVIPVDKKGNPHMEKLADALRKDTILVTMMMVNNEVGTVFPLTETAKLIREKSPDCHFHVDGVQGYGRLPIDLKKTDIDTFSLSGHKIGAPKGVGVLYVKSGLRLLPLIHGGGQEKAMRAGTENFYYIGALSLAAKLALKDREVKNKKLWEIKNYLIKCFRDEGIDFVINGSADEKSVPYILNVSFPHVKSEVLLHYLEGNKIYVSQGSACHSKTKGSSETLKAMGKNDEERDTALRFSFGDDTKFTDMPEVARIVKQGAQFISEMQRGK
ncbi:MAG: cysteine desulfurase family protein [Clostridiales bacterium]